MPIGELGQARLEAIAASDRALAPDECAERARLAAAVIELGRLDRGGSGEAVLLWRDEHSEAWLNLWWQPRDTGYHDHDGSCVGVHVIAGRAWNEPLMIGAPAPREYGPGDTFWFPGDGIHRMDHQAGAVTVHVYSPPIRSIGHYDLHDGQLRRTPGLPDEPSPPSGALFEALHHGAAGAVTPQLPGPGEHAVPESPLAQEHRTLTERQLRDRLVYAQTRLARLAGEQARTVAVGPAVLAVAARGHVRFSMTRGLSILRRTHVTFAGWRVSGW